MLRKQFSRSERKTVKAFSPEVTRKFFAYDWPGNVRQLRNSVQSMVVLDQDELLGIDDLPPELAEVDGSEEAVHPGSLGLVGQPMEVWERRAIEETLGLTNGNREEAARILGIGARTLYRKLDKYELG